MVLIWGVQGSASSKQTEIVGRTKRYITSLADANERIIVPTPAVTEYLQFFDPRERRRQLQLLERHFIIVSYDLPAAYLAADLAYRAGGPKATGEIPRQAVKTDIEILATAIVHGATSIITNNRSHFERLAAGRILVSEVPAIPEQQPLDLDPPPAVSSEEADGDTADAVSGGTEADEPAKAADEDTQNVASGGREEDEPAETEEGRVDIGGETKPGAIDSVDDRDDGQEDEPAEAEKGNVDVSDETMSGATDAVKATDGVTHEVSSDGTAEEDEPAEAEEDRGGVGVDEAGDDVQEGNAVADRQDVGPEGTAAGPD